MNKIKVFVGSSKASNYGDGKWIEVNELKPPTAMDVLKANHLRGVDELKIELKKAKEDLNSAHDYYERYIGQINRNNSDQDFDAGVKVSRLEKENQDLKNETKRLKSDIVWFRQLDSHSSKCIKELTDEKDVFEKALTESQNNHFKESQVKNLKILSLEQSIQALVEVVKFVEENTIDLGGEELEELIEKALGDVYKLGEDFKYKNKLFRTGVIESLIRAVEEDVDNGFQFRNWDNVSRLQDVLDIIEAYKGRIK